MELLQLVKHALGLRTRGQKRALGTVLVYLYAEPTRWEISGKPVDPKRITQHRREVAQFAGLVRGDDVVFAPVRWADLIGEWKKRPTLTDHATALAERFGSLG